MSAERNFEPDHLVKLIADDPSQPADATVLTGFLGPSVGESFQRLYLDAGLSSYVEISEADILHARKVGSEESPLGTRTVLWVRRGAQLRHTVTSTRTVQAEFLSGDVAAGMPSRTQLEAAAVVRAACDFRAGEWTWPRWSGFDCDGPRGSLSTCSQWCSWTEGPGPKCTNSGPRCEQ